MLNLPALQKSFNNYYMQRINPENINPEVININRLSRECEKRKINMCNVKILPVVNWEKANYCNYFQSMSKFEETS